MAGPRLLIANRSEIAVRIIRTARELGYETIAICSEDDKDSLHTSQADIVETLPGFGPSAYLNIDNVLSIARSCGAEYLHPGYGFLSESSNFASRVEENGLTFVGPTVEQLALFGDKVAARATAVENQVPVLMASPVLESPEDLQMFLSESDPSHAFIIKAAGGGGGRGMRIVRDRAGASALWESASAEARVAFGDSRLYAEQYLENVRHIEVQIVGDGTGAVCHLWDRDCTLQRRHQKIIEIAPAPELQNLTRKRMLDFAVKMAKSVKYRGLGTFEFLLDVDQDCIYFIETNARLQVEHTVTEEVLGLDLVHLQLEIAAGKGFRQLGLETPPRPTGYALQMRVNAETLDSSGNLCPASGFLDEFILPGGLGVRVDSAASKGTAIHPSFDSLIAKLIVHVGNSNLDALLKRARRVAKESTIVGCETNLPLLRAILEEDAIEAGQVNTTFIEDNAEHLTTVAAEKVDVQIELQERVDKKNSDMPEIPSGNVAVEVPMRGSVINIDVTEGSEVEQGQVVALIEAMKMHHEVIAPASGIVTRVFCAAGDVIDVTNVICWLKPSSEANTQNFDSDEMDVLRERSDLTEVWDRHSLGIDDNRPLAVAKRRKIGSRTARENIEDLCDQGSFVEYGALAIAAQRRRRSLDDLQKSTPADGMIAGFGTINSKLFGEERSRCAALAYDYTVLAGTQGHHNHKKKDRMFELAAEWETPIVFYTEGGGGRPGDVDTEDLFMSWLDIKTFATWPQLSGVAPRIAINSGRCYAGNAVIFGCADITIATKNSNIGLAGPAMIEGGGLGKFRPEQIGPIDVQQENGVVDIVAEDEADATGIAKQLLGCFQGKLPDWSCSDQRRLRHLIPEDRLRVYDVRKIIENLADTDSVIELRPYYGTGLITALVRIEGQPFGLIANDPRHLGGAIDGEGGEKGGRFLQMCDAFGLPIVSLCDTPGFMVGPDSEKTAAVRRGSRLIIASANLSVPLFTVVIRKGYGLGAQAMAGGSFKEPFFTIAWPTAEMGPMGLEGAVELGFRKELEATPTKAARDALFRELVDGMYEKGKGISVASVFEIDAVIDPAETRNWLIKGLRAAGTKKRRKKSYIDVW